MFDWPPQTYTSPKSTPEDAQDGQDEEGQTIPGQIQVSENTYALLKNDYSLTERGTIDVKGKGEMKTYILDPKE